MDCYKLCLLILAFLGNSIEATQNNPPPRFDENYKINYGNDHIFSSQRGRLLQLNLDKDSGSGIVSKLPYSSGFFHMKVKLPGNDTAGVVTTFYLKSLVEDGIELDFEFLGNRKGKTYIFQTNVFAQDSGAREQRLKLWFDPTKKFHDYRILWNPHLIVFFIDDVPVRVFRNKTKSGANYPSKPMSVFATIWNGDDWATDGGRQKINYTDAPFKYQLQDFSIFGCPSNSKVPCDSTKYWWNRYKTLNSRQRNDLRRVKRKYIIYDYCNYSQKFPECTHQSKTEKL